MIIFNFWEGYMKRFIRILCLIVTFTLCMSSTVFAESLKYSKGPNNYEYQKIIKKWAKKGLTINQNADAKQTFVCSSPQELDKLLKDIYISNQKFKKNTPFAMPVSQPDINNSLTPYASTATDVKIFSEWMPLSGLGLLTGGSTLYTRITYTYDSYSRFIHNCTNVQAWLAYNAAADVELLGYYTQMAYFNNNQVGMDVFCNYLIKYGISIPVLGSISINGPTFRRVYYIPRPY